MFIRSVPFQYRIFRWQRNFYQLTPGAQGGIRCGRQDEIIENQTEHLTNNMKKTFIAGSAVVAGLLLTGCETTGLSTREQHNSYASLVYSLYRRAPDGEAVKPPRPPINLAVAQIGEASPDNSFMKELGRDTNLVRRLIEVPMPGENPRPYSYNRGADENKTDLDRSDARADQVKSARNLARDLGAQYLLLVGGSIDSYNSRTPLTVLDVTIIGGAVAPGVKVHSDGKAAGALIEVETGRIVFLADAQLQKTGLSPSYYTDERRDSLNASLRTELLKQLAANVLNRMGHAQTESASLR